MNLLHPASAGAAVNLWFVDGAPVRVVHGATNYRVTAAEQWLDEAGWTITARSTTDQPCRFSVRSTVEGWELSSAG